MSEAHKAVFFSYASQDADAAKRIADALRAAGVEVWFDQSELVGGDQWDAKIRGQIGSCALFVPVISANTQARLEGYFRIEWKLAAQRTYAMADEKTFLLPVLIDATRDSDAKVPAEFRAVQWTKLPGGETSPVFCARVKKLLGGEPSEGRGQKTEVGTRDGAVVRPKKLNRLWLAPVLLAVFVGATLALRQPWRKAETPAVAPPPVSLSPGATELARVRAQLTPDRWQREDFAAMAPTLDRLLEANPELADAWAMRSIINSLQVLRNYDSSTKPLEVGKAAADRAARLAPGSPLADIATGMHLVAMTSRGGDARACRPYLDRGVAALPPDALTRYAQLASYWFAYDFDQVQRCGEAWRVAEPQASFPPWIFAQLNVVRRRPAEADKWAEMAMADPNITGVRAYFTAFESRYYLCADVRGAWAVLQRVPAAGRSVHRVVHGRWLVAMADHRWDEALQELAQVPESFLFDRSYHGPKALLAGLAHQRAGRLDAAAAQFREAERLLREHLTADSDNEELHVVLAVALACAGRGADARSELGLVEPLVKGRQPSIYRGTLVMTIAQAYAVLGDYSQLAPWLRKLFAEPSQFPFTPASLRLDPRFAAAVEAPEIQALFQEFAALDQPVAVQTEDRGRKTEVSAPIDQKSVAVLAFANLSDDKANEYFSDGISEELLNVLAKIPGLKVSARTSAFYFKGKEVPIPEIARQLGVAYVVEGSVRKQADKVRITAQLIKAADGFHVWSDTFTRELKDIFAVQDEIAGLLVGKLRATLIDQSLTTETLVMKGRTQNLAAYELFLQGNYELNKKNRESLLRSVELFAEAVRLDSAFALAWAKMAVAHSWLYSTFGPAFESHRPLLQAAARRAAEIAPDLAEAQVARAEAALAYGEWRTARQAAQQAVALAPVDANVLQTASFVAIVCGELTDAVSHARRSLAADPLDLGAQLDLGIASLALGDQATAEEMGQRMKQSDPHTDFGDYTLAVLRLRQNRPSEAKVIYDQAPVKIRLLSLLSSIEFAMSRRTESDAALANICKDNSGVDPFDIACVYAFRGERDQAFTWLETAYARGRSLYLLRSEVLLQSLHNDPRWSALLRKFNLADDQLK